MSCRCFVIAKSLWLFSTAATNCFNMRQLIWIKFSSNIPNIMNRMKVEQMQISLRYWCSIKWDGTFTSRLAFDPLLQPMRRDSLNLNTKLQKFVLDVQNGLKTVKVKQNFFASRIFKEYCTHFKDFWNQFSVFYHSRQTLFSSKLSSFYYSWKI